MIDFVSAADGFELRIGPHIFPVSRLEAADLAEVLLDGQTLRAIVDDGQDWSYEIWKLEPAGEFQRHRDEGRGRVLLRRENHKWHLLADEAESLGRKALAALAQ